MSIWDYLVAQQENREKASNWEHWEKHYFKEITEDKKDQ